MPAASSHRSLPLSAVAILLLGLLITAPALAQTVEPEDEQPAAGATPWERAFYKTLTYEFLANASDVVILSALAGGVGSVGAGFMAVNVLSAATAYYTHEMVWSLLGPPPDEASGLTVAAKTVTYRVVSTSRSFGLAYLFAGDASVASAFALAGNIADTLIYIGNEYAWGVLAPPPRQG